MTFAEFLASDASAKAEYDKALALAHSAGKAEAQATAKAVSKYLTSDVYSKSKPIIERALKAISGEGTLDALESAIAMFDLMAEQKKTEAATAETHAQGETPPLAQSKDSVLLARAAELKIDLAKVEAYAKANGFDATESLKAAIEDAEQRAKDAQFVPTGGDGR